MGDSQVKFLKGNISRLTWPILFFVLGFYTLHFVLYVDPRENQITLKGHVTDINLHRGTTELENTFDLRFKEHSQIFVAQEMSIADQNLLAMERIGTEFTFSVEKAALEAEDGSKIRVFQLATKDNVYLNENNIHALMQKSRSASAFFAFLCFSLALFLSMQLWNRYRWINATPDLPQEYDALVVLVVKYPNLSSFLLLIFGISALLLFYRDTIAISVFLGAFILFMFWYGRFRKRSAWIKDVLEKDAEIEARFEDRPKTSTPKHVKAVQHLLKSGANIDAKDKFGNTPLHISAEGGHLEAVKLLLENRADPNVTNKAGETPLMIAARRGSLGSVKTLVESGAKLSLQDKNGWDALKHAELGKKNRAVISFIQCAIQENEDSEDTENSPPSP